MVLGIHLSLVVRKMTITLVTKSHDPLSLGFEVTSEKTTIGFYFIIIPFKYQVPQQY